MSGFKFGGRSNEKLATIHKALQLTAHKALSYGMADFCVFDGRRTAEEQNKLFNDGKSQCDGYKVLSYHQSGMAMDCVPVLQGKLTWDKSNSLVITGLLLAAFCEVVKENPEYSKFRMRSGIDWNENRIYDIDNNFDDGFHVELRNKK